MPCSSQSFNPALTQVGVPLTASCILQKRHTFHNQSQDSLLVGVGFNFKMNTNIVGKTKVLLKLFVSIDYYANITAI